jgi:recombination protein RecA
VLRHPALRPLAPPRADVPAERFGLDALSGRLTELCGGPDGAQLTCAFGLVLEAQRRGEPAAYIGGVVDAFYPPDAAQSGVDLDALVVVRARQRAARARVADELCRSGAFALLIIDLAIDADEGERRVPPALVSRLLGLSQKHATAVVFLSPDEPSPIDTPSPIGALVSLRAQVQRRPLDDSRCVITLEAVKDKRRAPGWMHSEICRAPVGMC